MGGFGAAVLAKMGIVSFLESLAYAPNQVNYLDGLLQSNCQEISIDTEYGALHGLHLKSPKKKALIIHFHGSGYNLTKHIGHVDWLPELGYDVVMFDYLGYGNSDGTPSRSGIEKSSSQLVSVVAKTHPKDQIFLFGQSLGGAIALSAYIKNHSLENIKGIIVDSTFSSYSRMARLKLERKGSVYKILSASLPYLLDTQYDPVETVKKVQIPLLILHSKTDSIVPFDESILLFKESNSDTDFWMQVGPDHTGVFRPNYQNYRLKLDRWISSKMEERT